MTLLVSCEFNKKLMLSTIGTVGIGNIPISLHQIQHGLSINFLHKYNTV